MEGLLEGIIASCGSPVDRTVEIAVPLLSTLTTSFLGAEACVERGAVEGLMASMEREHRDVKVFSICCLANLAAHEPLRPRLEPSVPVLQRVATESPWSVAKKEAAYVLSLLEKPVAQDVEVHRILDEVDR